PAVVLVSVEILNVVKDSIGFATLARRMAGERTRLVVQPRDTSGSAEARRLRRAGFVPGVLYGAGKAAHPFAVADRDLRRIFGAGHGLHQIVDVVLEGRERPHHAVLKDYQLDPTRPRLLHIDLHEIR